MSMFSVGIRGVRYRTAQEAVIAARERVKQLETSRPVDIWQWPEGVVIAVVTDDASGLVVHRLKTWPEDQACAYE